MKDANINKTRLIYSRWHGTDPETIPWDPITIPLQTVIGRRHAVP